MESRTFILKICRESVMVVWKNASEIIEDTLKGSKELRRDQRKVSVKFSRPKTGLLQYRMNKLDVLEIKNI